MENSNFVRQGWQILQDARHLFFGAKKLDRAGDEVAAFAKANEALDIIDGIDHNRDDLNWGEANKLYDRIEDFAEGIAERYVIFS